MNLFGIARKSIRQRAVSSSLTAFSVALGVMLMVSVLVIHGIVERVFSQRSIGYDLVVGPKGSDLQLVLNTVYRVSQPIENLPYLYYQELLEDPRVEEAIPFCLGDVTQEGAFPLVGTNERYFELEYAPGNNFALRKTGHGFQKSFDAIIGSQVAKTNGWTEGSQFMIVHGGAESDHVHDEKFTVVGILAPTGTPNDKTVFVHLNGFYAVSGHEKPPEEALDKLKVFFAEREDIQKLTLADMGEPHSHDHDHGADGHEHHHDEPLSPYLKEVTAVLLITKSVVASRFLAAELKEGVQAQAVNPIIAMRYLMDVFVGNVRHMLLFLTAMIVIVSFVGIFVSIYNSMNDRKREIAIMRALGASRQTVLSIIVAESILLCVIGGVLGLLLGHGLVFAAAPIVEDRSGFLINPYAFEWVEIWLLPILVGIAAVVGFIPGMSAYRTDVADSLSR